MSVSRIAHMIAHVRLRDVFEVVIVQCANGRVGSCRISLGVVHKSDRVDTTVPALTHAVWGTALTDMLTIF